MMFREVFESFSALWSALVVPATEVFIHKAAHNPSKYSRDQNIWSHHYLELSGWWT